MVVHDALKRTLVALGEAQYRQSLRQMKSWFLWRSQETRNLRRTLEQWWDLPRSSRGLSRDITENPLDSNTMLDAKGTVSAVHVSRMRLQRHTCRT